MQALWGNLLTWPPNMSVGDVSCSIELRLSCEVNLCRSFSNVPCLPSFLKLSQNPYMLDSLLKRCRSHWACVLSRRLNFRKWPETVWLWHGGVFSFALQRRALVQDNFQKCSNHCEGFSTSFWLPHWHVQRRTPFSTPQLLKVLQHWCVFNMLTSKRALHQSNADFRHLKWRNCSGGSWFQLFFRSAASCPSSFHTAASPACVSRLLYLFDSFRAPWPSFYWLCLFGLSLFWLCLLSDCLPHCCCICPPVYRRFDF